MNKKLLPKNFFRDNPLREVSAARISYFSMTDGFDERLQNKILELLAEEISVERAYKIENEKEQIAQLDSGEAVEAFIRRGYDISNRMALCKRALSMQAEVMPLLLRRFCTSGRDEFIETTGCIFSRGEQAYIDQLKAMYPAIRDSYAQSMACLVFGIRGREETLPLLLEEYQRLKSEDPEGKLCQGPLLAIYILHGRA